MAQRIWQIGLVGIVMVCMLIVAAQQSDNHGEILFPASAGDSVYIRTHDGTRILIDTGNDAPALLSLLAHHQPLFATGVADILILTHPGVAWHGGRAALIQRGIGEVWVLGALHEEMAEACRQPLYQCQMVARGTTFSHDGLTLRIIDDHAIRIDWAGGAVLVAHSAEGLPDSGDWPTDGIRVVAMPWAMPPPRDLLARIAPTHIIYRSGQQRDAPARLSYAQRRVGGEHLLHRDIDGSIQIHLANPAQVWRETQE